MSTYAELNANYRRQKAALTRAANSGDPHKLAAAGRAGLASFERHGYPDDWSRWQRAIDDAAASIRYGRPRTRLLGRSASRATRRRGGR